MILLSLCALALSAVFTLNAYVAHVFWFWSIKARNYFLTYGESILPNTETILHGYMVSQLVDFFLFVCLTKSNSIETVMN